MPSFANLVRLAAPFAWERLRTYRSRFHDVGLPEAFAVRSTMRAALLDTQLELIPPTLRSGVKLAVDVGANVGSWSIGIANLTDARTIIAIEPAPDVFQHLKQNTSKHKNIQCLNSAIGASEAADVEFRVEAVSAMSSLKKLTHRARSYHDLVDVEPKVVRVPLSNLDTLLANHGEISLLKIDVQGGEREVLQGAAAVLKRTRVLVIEVLYCASYYEDAWDFDQIYRHITATTPLRLWTVSEPHMAPDGTPMWADAVFVGANEGPISR